MSDTQTPQPKVPESLEDLLRRDLNAWIEAKAAIAKAQGK